MKQVGSCYHLYYVIYKQSSLLSQLYKIFFKILYRVTCMQILYNAHITENTQIDSLGFPVPCVYTEYEKADHFILYQN